jgi:acyl-CoA thioester hydrolase
MTETIPQDPGFVLPVRVYYADTDAGGVVYHARYLDMAERARTEMLRSVGWPVVAADGSGFVARRSRVEWLRPARLDDLLAVHTTVAAVGGSTMTLRQTIRRGAETLCEMEIQLVHVGPGLRPTRIPAALRARLPRRDPDR